MSTEPRECRQFKNIGLQASVSVIPAKAGTQNPVAGKYGIAANGLWIPAKAGMTVNMTTLPTENRPESTSAIPESAAPRKSGKLGRTNPAHEQKTAQPVGAEPRKASRPRKDKKTPEERREYERLRGQRPERREAMRKAAQARRQKAKELGLCRDCSNKAIAGQSMCEACAEKHRQARRKDDTARRARLKAERELNEQKRPQTPATQEGNS